MIVRYSFSLWVRQRTILFALACLSFFKVHAQHDAPSIIFVNTIHDFGDIREADGPVEHTFEFTNNGTSPLIIQDVRVSCGCTSSEWSKEPILQGEMGFITTEFNPSRRPGKFDKSLTIASNANVQQMKLHIRGNVEPIARSMDDEYSRTMGKLRVKSRLISFEYITNEKIVSQTFHVYNDSNREMKFRSKYSAPDHIKLNFSPQSLPPKTVGTIEVRYDPRAIKGLGHKTDMIVVKTDEWFNSDKKFGVIASIEEYFPPMSPEQLARAPKLKIEKSYFDFGTIGEGESVEASFVITNTGKEVLKIRQTRATCGCTIAKLDKLFLKPGESGRIEVTFNSSGKGGDQKEVIYIYSNDPANPTQKMSISGLVEEAT